MRTLDSFSSFLQGNTISGRLFGDISLHGSLLVQQCYSTTLFQNHSTTCRWLGTWGTKPLDLRRHRGPNLVGLFFFFFDVFSDLLQPLNSVSQRWSKKSARVGNQLKVTSQGYFQLCHKLTKKTKNRQLLVRWYKCDDTKQIEGGVRRGGWYSWQKADFESDTSTHHIDKSR